jgi:hypothetical protein
LKQAQRGLFSDHHDDSDPVMTKVFIAGSREIIRLPAEVKVRVNTTIDNAFRSSSAT